MTAPLAIVLGSGSSFLWSWFFWVYIHPIASILWFSFCLFAFLISVEIYQFKQHETKVSRITYVKNPKPIYTSNSHVSDASNSRGFSATEVIEVIVKPPPQLPYPKSKDATKQNPQMAQIKIMQLPSSID